MTSNNKWLLNWVILSIAAPLVSFIGGYSYLYALGLLYPIAQTYALAKVKHIKMPWLWLIYCVYWLIIVVYSSTIEFAIISIIASSILGQIILYLMFDTFGKLQWLLYNSTGICIVLFVMYLMRELHISNDLIEIILIIILSFIIAFLSGIGIKKGYLK